MHLSSISFRISFAGVHCRALLIGAVTVLLLTTVTAFPENHDGTTSDSGIYLAAGGGGALYTPTGAAASKSYLGFVGRGDVGYRFGDLRVAAQGSYSSFTLGSTTIGDIRTESRVSMITVMATGWYDIPIGSTLLPYVGAGLGLVMRTATVVVGDNTQSASESDLGAQAGVGISLRLSSSVDLQLGYRILAPFGDPSLQIFHVAEIGAVYRL